MPTTPTVNSHAADLESSSSQYFSVASAAHVGLALTTDFTFEAWVKLETRQTQGLIYRASASNGYILQTNGTGDLIITFSDGANSTTIRTTGFFESGDVGKWVHFALAVDISVPSATIYKNGVSQSVTTNSSAATTLSAPNNTFYIGSNGGAEFLDGKIDEVRVWSDIRTAQEVLDNYGWELVGNEANLVGYWKLNNALTDSTASANTLTNNNTATFTTDVPFLIVNLTDTLSVITDTISAVLSIVLSFVDSLRTITDSIFSTKTPWSNQSKNDTVWVNQNKSS